jgi:hypothetical protein
VEDFLPQIQKAPQNIPGEFITFKYQIPNVKLQISKKKKLTKVSNPFTQNQQHRIGLFR